MKLDELFPSRYLKAADLQGREVPETISHVALEEMEGKNGKEQKGVVYFRNKQKGLVLNQVNGNTIGDVHGDEMDNWGNCPIILYPDRTQFGGRMVDCIRVKLPQASTPQVPPSPASMPPSTPQTDLDDVDADLAQEGDAQDGVPF